jgi:hypothetical protein
MTSQPSGSGGLPWDKVADDVGYCGPEGGCWAGDGVVNHFWWNCGLVLCIVVSCFCGKSCFAVCDGVSFGVMEKRIYMIWLGWFLKLVIFKW